MSDLIQILEPGDGHTDAPIMLTATQAADQPVVPVGFVPLPAKEYNQASARKELGRRSRASVVQLVETKEVRQLGKGVRDAIKIPIPIPLPLLFGSRALIFKQDPSVTEIGIRKVLLRGAITTGPRSARIVLKGVAPVAPNTLNDFIQTPGTEAFDAVHTFAVVHQTLTLCQRAVGSAIKWQWNSGTNVDPIQVFPHAGETMNAFYSRTARSLKFFFFHKPGTPPTSPLIQTCQSLDIVAHETGHAVLDSLKPGWIGASANPQTGALHEAFGDLTAIFLVLSQLDQVEALIVQTKGNLHNKTFLSDLAEEFGLALGRPNGLRNADNDLRLSDVTSEVHSLSQVFTGGIYDVLADIFTFERNVAREDEAATLLRVGQYVFNLLLRAIQASPATNATFADVVNKMLAIAFADGKPAAYRQFLRNRFTFRQVVVSSTPLAADGHADMEAVEHEHLDLPETGWQDRSGCCGTMRLREYGALEAVLDDELKALRNGVGGGDGKPRKQVAAE